MLFSPLRRTAFCFWLFGLVASSVGAERELIRDPHFQSGFFLLEPKPGQRVVCGKTARSENAPAWDLAQWSSRFPLNTNDCSTSAGGLVCSNRAKQVITATLGNTAADLSLAVNAGYEYPRARNSVGEPWVHLLVQQDLSAPPSLGELASLRFHVEARLRRSQLISSNDYLPSVHAAQFLIYFTVANRNPNSPGYQECFWFGIPVYDNRERIVSSYEAQDFGDTKLFIFTPSSATFAEQSTHDGKWVRFEKDLLPLMRQGLEHARAKGFIKGPGDLADYRPLGIFAGWEVPGRFDVGLQIRNLSLTARDR